MKPSFLLASFVASILPVVSCGGSGGQTSAPSTPPASVSPAPENVEQAITKLEHDWVTAILAKDSATIARVLADDFKGTTDDVRYGKAEAIEDVKTGTHETLDVDNLEVRVFGNTAVVTLGQTEKSRQGKEEFSVRYLYTNVWVKRDGQWRAVSSHGSRVR